MGFKKIMGNVVSAVSEGIDNKKIDIDENYRKLENKSDDRLLELIHTHLKRGGSALTSSERIAASKVLVDRGYENEEILETIKSQYGSW